MSNFTLVGGAGGSVNGLPIVATQMFAPILIADPTFAPIWAVFLEEWQGEKALPYYLALTALARHLVRSLEEGDTVRFDAIFLVVENLLINGDSYVSEAASVGLLEDLQNSSLYREMGPDAFLPWLRPASRAAWERLNAP